MISSHEAPGEKLPSLPSLGVRERSDDGSEGAFLLACLESPQRTVFTVLGSKRKVTPPPPHEAAFTAFTASAPKAVHPTSVLSGSAAEGNEGAFQVSFEARFPWRLST